MTQLELTRDVALAEFGLTGEGSVRGFDPRMMPTANSSFIPKINPSYVFKKEELGIFAAWWEVAADEPLFISGPHGSGKTSFVQQFCARVGAPLISITGRSRLDRSDLVGHYVIGKDKTMRFVDGPLTRAWRNGFVFLVNEMSAAPADLWLSVNELLEGAPLYIESTNEVIPKHPNCRIVMTDNTRGMTSDDDQYLGRHLQDAAVLDRFWKMRLTYMDRESEIRLLVNTTPDLPLTDAPPEEWKQKLSERLRSGAEKIRETYSDSLGTGLISTTISTRTLLRFRDLLVMSSRSPGLRTREAISWAIRIALTEAVDAGSALAIEKIMEAELGDICGSLAAL